jgi:hypothetical protein
MFVFKLHVALCQILTKHEFLFATCGKISQISNMFKIRPVAAELFAANGRMDGQTLQNV